MDNEILRRVHASKLRVALAGAIIICGSTGCLVNSGSCSPDKSSGSWQT